MLWAAAAAAVGARVVGVGAVGERWGSGPGPVAAGGRCGGRGLAGCGVDRACSLCAAPELGCTRKSSWHWACEPRQPVWAVCGGRKDECAIDLPCRACAEGLACARTNEWHWQCEPVGSVKVGEVLAQERAVVAAVPAGRVPLYGRCGGRSEPACGRDGACLPCGAGATCTRFDEYHWQCEPRSAPARDSGTVQRRASAKQKGEKNDQNRQQKKEKSMGNRRTPPSWEGELRLVEDWAAELAGRPPPSVPANSGAVASTAPSAHGGRRPPTDLLPDALPRISVRGDKFIRNGSEWRFVGFNNYYMMEKARWKESRHMVDEVLDKAAALGMTVMRTWAFDDTPKGLQIAPGIFNEEAFQALDYVVAEAGRRGIYLLLALTNYWSDYGGVESYVKWCTGRNSLEGLSVSMFYSNQKCRRIYANMVRTLLERRNTITGRLYKDDPTIMGWDLMNEPRNPGGAKGWKVRNWIEEMSGYIKSIAPDALVTTGMEGFFGPSTPLKMKANNPGSDWQYWACQGTDFHSQHDMQSIDFTVAHLYPKDWLPDPCASDNYCRNLFAQSWTDSHIEQAQKLGKPFVLEEFGYATPGQAGNAEREDYFKIIYAEMVEATEQGGAGTLFWIFSSVDYADYDGYTVYSGKEGVPKPLDTPHTAQEVELQELRDTFRNKEKVENCKKQFTEADNQGRIKDAFQRMEGGARAMSAGTRTSHDGVLGIIEAAVRMANDDE